MAKIPYLLHVRGECAALAINLRRWRARQEESHWAQTGDGSEAQLVALCPPREENNFRSSCGVGPMLTALVSLPMMWDWWLPSLGEENTFWGRALSYHGAIVVLEFMFPLPQSPNDWAYATWLREKSQLNRILRYLCQERCVCEFFFPWKGMCWSPDPSDLRMWGSRSWRH